MVFEESHPKSAIAVWMLWHAHLSQQRKYKLILPCAAIQINITIAHNQNISKLKQKPFQNIGLRGKDCLRQCFTEASGDFLMNFFFKLFFSADFSKWWCHVVSNCYPDASFSLKRWNNNLNTILGHDRQSFTKFKIFVIFWN